MSRIFVDDGAVQAQTANLRSRVVSQVQAAEGTLSRLQSSLNSRDSASNASYIRAVESTQRKAQSTARGFTRLLNFIAGSSAQMRLQDERAATAMRAGLGSTPPAR